MENIENEIQEERKKDIKYNWATSSSFLFYVQLFCILAFILGGCYRLYQSGYQGKPDVEVPESTMYSPKYK